MLQCDGVMLTLFLFLWHAADVCRRVRLSRLPEGLHASQAALDLLMKVGWRPLLVILPGDNSPDWTWVLEAGPEAIARASAAAEALSKSS
jgi:hypothetical protein